MNNFVLNDLFDYKGLKIYQIPGNFKFSLDSILLAEFVKTTNNTTNILDLCSGNAPIPLILATKTSAHITGFEIQPKIYDLGINSIKYNKLDKQINFYNEDILKIDEIVKNQKYDIITCNPPYFKTSNKDYQNNFSELAIARHEITITLEDVFKIASTHMNDKGEFYLVHRSERLDEIIILANKYNLNIKNIQLIQTKSNNKPTIVLVRAIKGAKYGVKINKIINIENLKTYQNIFEEDI